MKFIKASEKKRIIEELNERFGIEKIPYLLIETGKEKIRAFSGNLSKNEIIKLNEFANVEIIGIYLLKKEDERKLRLSFDAVSLFKEQINKNVVEINNEELELWMKGNEINKEASEGVVVIKHEDDYLGAGVSTGSRIFNYVPKERRVRK